MNCLLAPSGQLWHLLLSWAPHCTCENSGLGAEMLADTTCLFAGLCTALLAVALAYYFYW